MESINKSTIIIPVFMLLIGLGLGWLFFSTKPITDFEEHNHLEVSKNGEWTCSMHPQIRQKEPGNCPLCGMSLIPVEQGDEGDQNPMEIKMSPTAMKLASVQTAIVSEKRPVSELSLTGKVQMDERAISSQTTHISGRIEKLLVNATGEYVRKGQVIAYIYSPELLNAQKELFEAQKFSENNPGLFKAAKEKLQNWKLTTDQITSILKAGKPSDNFPILADQNGVVLSKNVNVGDHLMQGGSLYEIADLSSVWVLFDLHESDIGKVKVGDSVKYQVSSIPEKEFSGKITFIDPIINLGTRVAKARIVISNNYGKLKPGMFVSGNVKSNFDEETTAIIVPKSAVMWTGKKSVVYIKSSSINGIGFMMREVNTGASLGDSYLIKSGLEVGEEIAINGTFSIDAAAQLAGKPSMMNPQADGITNVFGHDHGGNVLLKKNSNPVEITKASVSDAASNALNPLFENYFKLKNALVGDDFNEAKEAGKSLKVSLDKIEMSLFTGAAHAIWMQQSGIIKKNIEPIDQQSDIEEIRNNFIYISEALIILAESFEVFSETIYVQHCPMADGDNGADWLSREDEILNPYFGASMLSCGEVKKELTK